MRRQLFTTMLAIVAAFALLTGQAIAQDEHGNTPATATVVAIGSVTPGALQASDVDVFRFTVVTPGLYVFYTRGSTDTTGRLLDGAATQLDIDADSGEALNMRFEKQLAAGTYYVEVLGAADPAGYAFHVEGPGAGTVSDDHGSSPYSATTVAVGSTTAGALDVEGDVDYFRFTITTQATYYIYSRGLTNVGAAMLNAQLVQIDLDDDSGELDNFRFEKLLAPGTYTLRLSGIANPAGYTLHIEGPASGTASDDHGSSPWSATPVSIGSVTPGALDVLGDIDYFRFNAPVAGTYVFYSRGPADTGGTLFNAADQQVDFDSDSGEGGNFRLEILLAPGAYFFRIAGATAGPYTFHVEGPGEGTASDDHGFSPWSATRVGIGSVNNATLDIVGDIDYFRFTVLAAGTYSMFTSGAVDTFGVLYGSAVQQLNFDDNGGGGGNFRFDMVLNPGTYYLKVFGVGSATGAYSLHVLGQPGNCVGFGDVGDGSAFCGNVEWLKNRGITLGCVAGVAYCPNDSVTRLQMAAFLNRLGDALGTTPLSVQQTSGALDPDLSPVVCTTSAIPAATFPRRAYIDALLAVRSTVDLELAADPAISVDAGTTWLPLTGHNHRGFAEANRWGRLRTLGHADIPAGQSMRFAIIVSRAGLFNTASATDSACNLRVRVEHRNAFAP